MEEDRMSQLPDDIRLLILRKIDRFEAIKTSILSHRWKNLWCLLPSLRSHHCRSELLSQLLSHPDADTEECAINSLRLHPMCIITLPQGFISCETLRELELRHLCYAVEVPGRLSLPNLKTIHLETLLVFDDDEVNMEPFSGLPELEKLTLIGYCLFTHAFVLKAPKLRVLELATITCQVKQIYTPLLTSFSYKSANAWECANVNLPMLEHVYLDIHDTSYYLNFLHHNFIWMLHQFENASTVSLTLDTLQVLDRNVGPFEQTPSPFPNMKCLMVMEGCNGIRAVSQGLLNYLTRTTLYCEVVLSPGVTIVEQISDEGKDYYEKHPE